MLAVMLAWRPPSGGSRSVAVSLQPAIPRRVAPQQSPLPLRRSSTIVVQSRWSLRCRSGRVRRQRGCHFYFARRVTFLSCADIFCACPLRGQGKRWFVEKCYRDLRGLRGRHADEPRQRREVARVRHLLTAHDAAGIDAADVEGAGNIDRSQAGELRL
jgi:hypothetical protein